MANLAIKGHAIRGKEVIEILEMLGGKNRFYYDGTFKELIYTIGSELELDVFNINSPEVKKNGYVIFTVKEFLERFPYKVGDRVRIPEYESEVCISKMYWDGNEVQYEVVTDEVEWYSAKELNEFNEPNKEETMEKEKNNWAKWDLPEGYEFQDKEGNVINTDVIKLVKKQPKYPKNFKECCEVLGCKANNFFTNFSYNGCDVEISEYEDKVDDLLHNFRKLIYCRNAYWKIAGEQMGLGKPWEPKWEIDNVKYSILVVENEIRIGDNEEIQRLLVFPTEEMRDAFLENFGHLIELCKELL